MKLEGLANICALSDDCLTNLLKGFVDDGISKSLNMKKISLQIFIDGGTSVEVATKLGITVPTLQELRNVIEREGAIGIVIGLMIKEARCYIPIDN